MKAAIVTPKPPPSTVVLEMTLEETRDLIDVCRNVVHSSYQTFTRQARATAILDALKKAGVAK